MIHFAKPAITNRELFEISKVLKSGWLTTGKVTQKFARLINEYIGSKYCLLVNSCTSALHLALICAGVNEGDEVITTPMTFVSTINSIMYLKAKPVFVDIKENDLIIDENKIEEKITKKTKAILVVHYGGFSADLCKIWQTAKKYGLQVIEDAAHAFGSKYKGEFIGKSSMYCCFSFYATKNITTGEGGALVTNKKNIYDRASILTLHGMSRDSWKRYTKVGNWRYDIREIGYKYNLTDIQSALGIAQLERINQLKKKREIIYKTYKKALEGVKEIEIVKGNNYTEPFRHLFVIRIKSKKITRDVFIDKMKRHNTICSVHFIPVYKFSVYQKLININPKLFPQTERAFRECVSLPFSSSMTVVEVKQVVKTIKKILLN